jgi:hypothetical protein
LRSLSLIHNSIWTYQKSQDSVSQCTLQYYLVLQIFKGSEELSLDPFFMHHY